MSARPPDPDSLRYARHWEPVLAGPAHRLLDRIAPAPRVFLDLGAGTGSLALAAATRWPAAAIVVLDASGGMLSVAQQRVHDEGHDPDRFRWLPADAAAIPLDEATVDAAASSFMLQLADDRPSVLREVLRVLRPGGVFAFVTWLADELELPADEHFLDVLDVLEIEEGDHDASGPQVRDFRSLGQAREELSAAGFGDVEVLADELCHAWSAQAYLAFKEHYDERELFESLDPATRDRLRSELGRRLETLPASAFELRGSLVAAVARRPAGAARGPHQAAKGVPSSGRQTLHGR